MHKATFEVHQDKLTNTNKHQFIFKKTLKNTSAVL